MKIRFGLLSIAVLFCLPLLLPAQTTRRVLIEEVTGTWCQYCPYGSDSIRNILQRVPNAISVVYHNADPMATPEGDQIDDSLAVGGYPNAAIDRIIWNIGGTLYLSLSRSYWGAATSVRAAVQSPMALSVAGTYDTTSRLLSATVTMDALVAMPGTYVLYFMIVEDSLNYAQKKYLYDTQQVITVNPYWHYHVVRKVVTGGLGRQVTNTGFSANQQLQENVSWTLPSTWNVKKCKVVAFVVRNYGIPYGRREVQQALEERVFNNSTIFAFTPVNLISFSAGSTDQGVRLAWSASNETNNKGWMVERSSEGEAWHGIAFVDGRGTARDGETYVHIDGAAETGRTYFYRLRQIDFDGKEEMSSSVMVIHGSQPTAMRLAGVSPNPFASATSVGVDIAEQGRVQLQIFDAMGRLVSTLADDIYSPGTHSFVWKGNDASGMPAPNGMYFCRLTTSSGSEMRSMILAR